MITLSRTPSTALPARSRPPLLVALAAALVLSLGAFAPAAPPTPSADSTGDPALAQRLRAAVGDLAGQGFAVAAGDASTSARAAIGTAAPGRPLTAATPQEIGSVTKAMTGLLLADAVERGEVSPGTTLAEVHPDRDLPPELAATTLAELATHTSGLPRLSTRAQLRNLVTASTYGNPYAWDTPDSLLTDAAWTPLRTPRGEYAYSNLGFALLGQALAVRAGVPYPQLLAERVLVPLGMTRTAAVPGELPADRAVELGPDGRPTTPWLSAGSAPAGTGVYSTAGDLGRLAAAAASGRLPGARALEPVVDADGARAGWGWLVADLDGRTVLGYNGATYGVQSSVWAEPATGRWVAVTSPSGSAAPDTQAVALRLLGFAL
ncbi:beta-lactamase [Kineococcus radiotolerans SRS30216 = ATCC BAA-149]|uniref:Beta-lactamase n=1 Tax=Kineococcus radiotolerans (strain ATCC BAA-149 / DSM 14245 / SRS30216) TaxID=266940 RepID=A6W7F7_KINRD|nr:beta-lactamase [Kineococcus radiotolerans SRS30216 = ATCC BAA-149]